MKYRGPFNFVPYVLNQFFFKDFIYLFMRDTDREKEAETQTEEKQAPCRKPDTGLDPGSPGSHPGLEAVKNC